MNRLLTTKKIVLQTETFKLGSGSLASDTMGSLGPSVVSLQPKASSKPVGAAGHEQQQIKDRCGGGGGGFQMPLHYPRYKKADYEAMPEWRVDCLLREYGLPVAGDVDAKRRFAMGAFLWPDQY